MVDETKKGRRRLCELADVLGISVDCFNQEAPATRPEDTVELLRLWQGLRTPRQRLAALEALKKIHDEDGQ